MIKARCVLSRSSLTYSVQYVTALTSLSDLTKLDRIVLLKCYEELITVFYLRTLNKTSSLHKFVKNLINLGLKLKLKCSIAYYPRE